MSETDGSNDLQLVSLDPAEARDLVDRIRSGLEALAPLITRAYLDRAWLALGYGTWEEMVASEFGGGFRLPIPERRQVVDELTRQGMSTRAIGATLGVGKDTVLRDQVSHDATPADRPPTVGTDGKTYQRQVVHNGPPEPPFSAAEQEALKQQHAGRAVVVSMATGAVLGGRLWQWAVDNGHAVRIDRKSKWGNPYIVGEDADRDTCIALYRDTYLPNKALDPADLAGKFLGCWCAPLPCHGDILAQQANA